MIIIIHGPQGCGGSKLARALAAHFGKQRIVGDWDGRLPLPSPCIAFTHSEPPFAVADAQVISFSKACTLAHLKPC